MKNIFNISLTTEGTTTLTLLGEGLGQGPFVWDDL